MTVQQLMEKWLSRIDESQHKEFASDIIALVTPPTKVFVTETTVSSKDLRPLISVKFGKYSYQLTPETTRRIGVEFLEAAHAAELDAFMFQHLTQKGSPLTFKHVACLVSQFRQWRAERKEMQQPLATEKTQ